jgi:phosphatidylglycerol:prolipoprotein diacylglycerol transferase
MLPEFNLGFGPIPTYFVLISLVMSALVLLGYRKALIESQNPVLVMNLALLIMIFGFFGARLLHVVYEAPQIYFERPLLIFQFWLGGYVFYGGALSAFMACWIYLKWKRENWKEWADFLTPLIALGTGWGRLGCFFAGCCFGSVCTYPWAVQFQDSFLRHPTQLYQLGLETLFAVLTYQLSKVPEFKRNPGRLFLTYLLLHGLGRAFVETFRDDFRGALILGMGLSFWIALALSTTALLSLYLNSKSWHK